MVLPQKNKAGSWGACLARVFEVFPLICPQCKVELKPVAAIFDDQELVRLLTHLGQPAGFPVFRPLSAQALCVAKRGPPNDDCQLDPRVEQNEGIDPLPSED